MSSTKENGKVKPTQALCLSAPPSEWVAERQSQGWECLIVLECGRWGSQEVVTSPLFCKLTRLARCQCWPLVFHREIICARGHSLSPGRDLLPNCVARHRKPQLHTFSHLTPAATLGYSTKGERPLWRDLLALFLTREGVGIFFCPFGGNLFWLPLKARTCFSFASASPFLFVCAVFTTVVSWRS